LRILRCSRVRSPAPQAAVPQSRTIWFLAKFLRKTMGYVFFFQVRVTAGSKPEQI
jgi:hypothetical protein